jgi:hypothetical protein
MTDLEHVRLLPIRDQAKRPNHLPSRHCPNSGYYRPRHNSTQTGDYFGNHMPFFGLYRKKGELAQGQLYFLPVRHFTDFAAVLMISIRILDCSVWDQYRW